MKKNNSKKSISIKKFLVFLDIHYYIAIYYIIKFPFLEINILEKNINCPRARSSPHSKRESMDSDTVFYADPDEDVLFRETTPHPDHKQAVSTWLTLAIRLPAIFLADLILLHNEYLYSQIYSKFEFYFNAFIVSLISRFFLLLSLFVCLQIFTIKLRYAVNIFKFLGLMSLPFIFRPCIDYTRTTELKLFSFLAIPAPLLVIVIYSIVFTATVLLYTEIYRHIIFDTKRTQERYHRIDYNQESVNDLLENLLDMDTDLVTSAEVSQMSPEEVNAVMEEITDDCTKRRFYILAYFMASLVINEMSYFSSADKKHEDFNIISLGYLLLLFYDLTANLDQLILRFLIKVKYLGNLVSEYGFNNILSYNWFYRLKVPSLLRAHFLAKAIVFTCNFVLFYNYYFALNEQIEEVNRSKRHDSLVSYVQAMFLKSNETSPEDALLSATDEEEVLKSPIQFIESLQLLLSFEFIDQYSWEMVTSDSVIACVIFYGKMLALNLTDTILSIGSMTAVLAWKFNILGKFVTKLTATDDTSHGNHGNNNNNNNQNGNNQEEELLNVGDVSAIFFFLLSIQTGLSSLNGLQRIERLFKNYSLLFIAILHYFHTNYDSQLIQLSASSHPNWRSRKHLRLLSLCACLILIPGVLLFLIWQNFVISTWYLAATAFCVELIVKMAVTIVQYALFMRDSQRIYSQQKRSDEETDELSDKLDDHIYYVKGFGHVTEFLVAIFLFWNGVYILLFESYGGIRAVMICIHAYFHIFVQAKKGWSAYMKRRTAIEKLKRMAIFSERTFHLLETTADDEEYERRLHDACAICFSEVAAHETRITRCKHLFHSICLRKWLYIQDTCPMCHGVLYSPDVQPPPADT